jgi:Leucine-rich repeat (LRR) protein
MKGFTDTTELYLGKNKIVNAAPLAGLTNLKKLDLEDNPIVKSDSEACPRSSLNSKLNAFCSL